MKNIKFNIILINNIITFVFALLFYPLVPLILNFPSGTDEFDIKYTGTSYIQGYLIVIIVIAITTTLLLAKVLSRLNRLKEDDNKDDLIKQKEIELFVKMSMRLPYTLYIQLILLIVIPTMLLQFIYYLFAKISIVYCLKMLILASSIASLWSVTFLAYTRKIFIDDLAKMYITDKAYGIRIKIRNKIFLQILPLLVTSILFISLSGYSILVEEKGELLFKIYDDRLTTVIDSNHMIESQIELKKLLKDVKLEDSKAITFIANPNGEISTSNNTLLSSYFTHYMEELAFQRGGRVYDFTGEIQGVVKSVRIGNETWIIGIQFAVASDRGISLFIISFILLMGVIVLTLAYFSKSLTHDIAIVASSLSDIAKKGNISSIQKLPVTSNDEVGDLVIAYNKILDLQKEQLATINEKNDELSAMNEELTAMNEQLKDYANTVEELVVTKERNRFARDVHDTLGHSMTLLISLLEVCSISYKKDPNRAEEKLQKAIQVARDGLKELRRSISGLSPEKLEKNSLVNAVNNLVNEFRLSGVIVELSINGIENYQHNKLVSDTIYRICQEALTNSLRHGKSEHANIVLQFEKEYIRLFIIDDGIGCSSITKGYGLKGMEQRVKNINGSFSYGSDGQKGFNISVKIPVRYEKIK